MGLVFRLLPFSLGSYDSNSQRCHLIDQSLGSQDALLECTYIDYCPLIESYLSFSLEGIGLIRGVSRGDLFSVMGLSGLYRGPK